MSYAQKKELSGNRTMAIIIVVVLQFILGYAIVTGLAYNVIKQRDPYHPVSLDLNCDNYHYSEYSAGADIIMTDPYPIGINATYSERWKTPCNTTYGDCGCDNCVGSVKDVAVSEGLDPVAMADLLDPMRMTACRQVGSRADGAGLDAPSAISS